MDADGSNPRVIVGDGNPVSPECSPDSTWIAYVRRRSDQQMVAVRSPIGGGTPTELIANLSRDQRAHLTRRFSGRVDCLGPGIEWHRRASCLRRPADRFRLQLEDPLPCQRTPLVARRKSLHYLLSRGGMRQHLEQPLPEDRHGR
jgi:hypothetical protein